LYIAKPRSKKLSLCPLWDKKDYGPKINISPFLSYNDKGKTKKTNQSCPKKKKIVYQIKTRKKMGSLSKN
jgi:hypothetical protein